MPSTPVIGPASRGVVGTLVGALAVFGGVLAGLGLASMPAAFAAPESHWFEGPMAMAVSGDNLFVVNYLTSSVTELNASTGALVRIIPGPSYGFGYPDAVAVYGPDLFVAATVSPGAVNVGGAVTEVNASTGAVVRRVSGSHYQFSNPGALALFGHDLFVANCGGLPSLTELNASTGALVRVASGPLGCRSLVLWGDKLFMAGGAPALALTGTQNTYSMVERNASTGALVRIISSSGGQESYVQPMALSGSDLFVSGYFHASSGFQLSELNASTGAVVRVISGPQYKFGNPTAMVLSGSDLFVASYGTISGSFTPAQVTELNASTGAVVRVISGPQYQFANPDALALFGHDLFVLDSDGVTELNASTGALVRVISGPA